MPTLKGLSDAQVTVAVVATSVLAALVDVNEPNAIGLVASVQLAEMVAEIAMVPVSVPADAPFGARAATANARQATFFNIGKPFATLQETKNLKRLQKLNAEQAAR